ADDDERAGERQYVRFDGLDLITGEPPPQSADTEGEGEPAEVLAGGRGTEQPIAVDGEKQCRDAREGEHEPRRVARQHGGADDGWCPDERDPGLAVRA